jgi:hypothetical protein
MLFYGDKLIKGNGSRMYGALVPAVLMYNYMMNHHSHLPSLHDWVTGMAKPGFAETASGLANDDYCSLMSLVQAIIDVNGVRGLTGAVAVKALSAVTTPYTSNAGVKDKSLGGAYRQIMKIFGVAIPKSAYDWSCSLTKKWPVPSVVTDKVDVTQKIYLLPDAVNELCKWSDKKTDYYAYLPGDASRCW